MLFHPSHARSARHFLLSIYYLYLLDMHSCSCSRYSRKIYPAVRRDGVGQAKPDTLGACQRSSRFYLYLSRLFDWVIQAAVVSTNPSYSYPSELLDT